MSAEKFRLDAMEAALDGQTGGRRMLGASVAWCVEENLLTGQIALDIGRWTATGRVVHGRFTWPHETPLMHFVAFSKSWTLVGGAFDVIPVGAVALPHTHEARAALRAQALTPILFQHAPAMSEKARARAATIKRGNSHRVCKRLTEAVFAHWPEGYRFLPVAFGQTAKLYRVRNDMGTSLLPTRYVEVRKPKTHIAQGKAEPAKAESWITSYHMLVSGVARIFGEDYAIAPDGATVYRPGEAEDCWSFPEISQEAALRFSELCPPQETKLPGCLAWYLVAENRKVVRVTWYNSRREAVSDFLQVQGGGLVEWRGHPFVLTPAGDLVSA